jgi:hypothetical protein
MGKRDNFRQTNWVRKVNLIIQIVLGVAFVIGLNYLAAKHYSRYDFSRRHRYALSPETISYLKQLKDPVEIIVMLSEHREGGDQVLKDLRPLLREFAYQARQHPEEKIKIQYIDIFQQRKKAEEMVQRYKLPFEDVVIVVCNNQHQLLTDADLYQTNNGAIVGYKAEQSILSALLDVCSEHKPHVGFLVGHGEMQMDDVDPIRGLSRAADVLRQRNITIENVDIVTTKEIPDELDLLIIAGPQVALLPEEVERIRRFLNERHGRLLVLLSPGKPHGLDQLFYEWGINTPDMVVLDTGEDFQASTGDMIVRRFAQHPITQILIDFQLGLLTGLMRPVDVDLGSPSEDKRKTTLLMASSDTSWAESGYRQGTNLTYTENVDIPGPIGLGVVSEQTVGTQLGIKIPTGRVVVLGNSDMISNNRIAQMGNGVLFLNSVNWSLNREHFLNIPPQKMQWMQLTLSRTDLWRLVIFLLLPPFGFFILGLSVYVLRRR